MVFLRLLTPRARRLGFVAPLVALLLVVLVGIAALALDAGMLMKDRREAQAAADAAALAAAIDLYANFDANQGQDSGGTAATSAKDTAKDNGFTDGTNNVKVTVNIPPASGTFQSQAGYAEVIITMQQQRFFSSVFESGNLGVKARAVARGAKTPKANGIIVLDPKDSNTLTTTNTANITVTGGGNIIVDSKDSKGGTISNSGNIQANELDFSGDPGYYTSGSGQFLGTIKSKQTPTPDPLAHLPPPSVPSQVYNNVNISNLPTSTGGPVPGYPTPGDPNGWTLPPGEYQNGLQISDNNSAHTYTLASGIYYFTNNVQLTANANIKSDPNGVLLYFSQGGLSLTAGGSVTLSPLQSGTYAGITIYEDRSDTSQDSITGQSTGNLNISGTVYTPAAKFTLTGSGNNYAIGSQYIVYQLVVTGSGNFNVLYNGPKVAPERLLYLCE